jgi:hypothetical protein
MVEFLHEGKAPEQIGEDEMHRFSVKVIVSGNNYGTVRVEALDGECAKSKAREIVYAMETKRAATVAASGGPAWAAQAPAFSDIRVTSVRVTKAAA